MQKIMFTFSFLWSVRCGSPWSRRYCLTTCCFSPSCFCCAASCRTTLISGAIHQSVVLKPECRRSSLFLNFAGTFPQIRRAPPYYTSQMFSLYFSHLLSDLNGTWKDNGISFSQSHLLYPSPLYLDPQWFSRRITTQERSIFSTVRGNKSPEFEWNFTPRNILTVPDQGCSKVSQMPQNSRFPYQKNSHVLIHSYNSSPYDYAPQVCDKGTSSACI